MNVIRKKNDARLLSLLLALCMVLSLMPTVTFAGTDREGYWGNTVNNVHIGSKENISIAEVNAAGDVTWENVAYCYNKERGYPVGKYDGTTYSNEYEYLEAQDPATWKNMSENRTYAGDMKDILTKIVFIGYPYEGTKEIRNILKNDCKVADAYLEDAFRTATQKAIWHITDNRPFRVPSADLPTPTGNTNVQVSEYVGKIIYEKALAYTGTPTVPVRLWKWKGVNDRNQHLLDTGYNIRAVEVTMSKLDHNGQPLAGVSIQVKQENQVIEGFTSTTEDKELRLAPGTYTYHEESVPEGCEAVEDFEFTVNENGTITLGEGVDENIVSVNEQGILVVKAPQQQAAANNSIEVQIAAKKTIDGGQTPIGNNTFTFKLTGNGQELTATSDANGNILFDAMTFTQPGTYTYTITEVTDPRDGVTFDFDKSEKTVTVTVSAQDLQTYDPNITYYAFEELDENFEYFYYVDAVPGNKGIVMYCTNKNISGPQDPEDVPINRQTYRVVINPTTLDIENNNWVFSNPYNNPDEDLTENLKKLFYYFETEDSEVIGNGDKQSLIWTATGVPSTISEISVNGRPASNNATTVLNNIYETVTLPPLYNLAFFIPTGTQAQEPPQGHPQPLATGYGAVVEATTNEVVFNNSTIEIEEEKGNLVITKTIEGDVTAEEAEGAITFTVTAPDGKSTEYTLDKFTKDENGKYTLELNDVLVGEYTVEETTKDIDGKAVTVTYKVNSGTETTGDNTTVAVTKDQTTTVDFNDSYVNHKGNLVITKTIEGDVTAEEAEGAISFTVTGPDNFNETYTLADFTNNNGVYTLTLNDVHVGQYTVEETTHDIDGKTVTVTYKVNGGQETEGDSTTAEVTNGGTATVAFKNDYSDNVGNLVITKTIEGDVTAEEAAGAISFTVTGPDNFNETYTLADFTESNGVYTLTLNDVHVGQYTVEETTHDIDGKTVTVTYKVNGGQETEGDSTTAEVTNGGTATVAFKNDYSDNVGNLVITKTIEGDVTAEEAAGAISFTVTGPDNFNETYTLADFTNNNGVYTLTLNDVKVGQYTVEETTHDIDGKTVTVTYKVNGGQETEGDSTTAEVTNGGTATVAFKNDYSDNVGNLVITKTIEGDVTAEEAAGAISFTVTGPDNFNETYTLADFTNNNGVYTLTLNDVKVGQYTVEETTHDIDGKTVTVKYTVNSGNETTGDNTTASVTKDQTTTVDFNNSYVNDKGNLVITKTIEGDVTAEEAEGAITFKVTAPDGTSTEYTLDKFTKGEDGKYTLALNDVLVGEYTVEETTKDIDGKTVTVKYTVNSGNETTGDNTTASVTKDQTTTVDFNNSYVNDKGNLVITKTIEGDVTAEEAAGAISFTVTGPDNFNETYTLADFTESNGVYTLTLSDVKVGQYTVEETTHDIDGKTVTVTYKVNGGQETEGDSTTAEVTNGGTATVDFKNDYSDNVGNLVITKTIEGDVTAEEAAGAISFTVTGPDNFNETYTLADFTNNNGVYTLTLNDVKVGQYTVEETTHDIDGKTVTVTYTVNGGQETEGDSTTAEVTKGETATVAFKNNYSNDTGKLVITKTIEGDVTAEEAEGAITFKVTAPDGTSKEYTLADFTKGEDGKYTLEINDVLVGEYTVEETTKDIDGKTVTVTYTVNGGQEATGDNATAEVTKDGTATVAFKNNYSNDTGKLVITKTIEGDVTPEEAEGAITFTVTAPDGTSTEYTFDKFTKGEDGKYTLELNDVLVGNYTVEETTKDIDGKTVTVTYAVNSGETTEGDKAGIIVEDGKTTTVGFNNNYENDKPEEENPGGDNPGEDNPGEDNPGEQPEDDNPGNDNPGGDNPSEQPSDDNSQDKPVVTGDDTNILTYVLLLELSIAICVMVVLTDLKKKRNNNC